MEAGKLNSSLGESSGPNVPVLYTLSNMFLSAPSFSNPTGMVAFDSGLQSSNSMDVPAFPSYARSGVISTPPKYGVNVGSFWQALSQV